MEIPAKYKERSHKTNLVHLEKLNSSDKKYTHLLLGDSLLENFSSDGAKFFNQLENKVNIFNAGVGGDRVENVFYRILNGKLLDHDNLKTVEKVYLLIGTNNLDNRPLHRLGCSSRIISGIETIIRELVDRLPGLKNIYVLQIPARSDINQDLIDICNQDIRKYLQESCESDGCDIQYVEWANSFHYKNFLKPEYYCDYVHFSSKGYEKLYETINTRL